MKDNLRTEADLQFPKQMRGFEDCWMVKQRKPRLSFYFRWVGWAGGWGGNCDSEFQSHSLHKGKADYRNGTFSRHSSPLLQMPLDTEKEKRRKDPSQWICAWIPCWSLRVEIKPADGCAWRLIMAPSEADEWVTLNKTYRANCVMRVLPWKLRSLVLW